MTNESLNRLCEMVTELAACHHWRTCSKNVGKRFLSRGSRAFVCKRQCRYLERETAIHAPRADPRAAAQVTSSISPTVFSHRSLFLKSDRHGTREFPGSNDQQSCLGGRVKRDLSCVCCWFVLDTCRTASQEQISCNRSTQGRLLYTGTVP